MILLKRSFFLLGGLVLILLMSSCGSSTSTGSSSTSSQPSPATAPSIVKTASATVAGKSVTILTNSQGMTLYYFTPDTSTKTVCTSGCTSTWPPLLFTGSGSPTASINLPGALAVYSNANGKQIIYNDHPLYTFTGDSAPGQTNGNGVSGKWFAATIDLAKNQTDTSYSPY